MTKQILVEVEGLETAPSGITLNGQELNLPPTWRDILDGKGPDDVADRAFDNEDFIMITNLVVAYDDPSSGAPAPEVIEDDGKRVKVKMGEDVFEMSWDDYGFVDRKQ